MVALVGVALVVALVIGVLAFVDRDHTSVPRPTTPPVDTGPIFPPVQTHVGPERYLVPSEVPEGYSLVRAATDGPSVIASSGEGGTYQNWIKLDRDGRPVGAFQIGWRPTDQASWGAVEPLDVNGHPGFWATELQSVVWEQDGQTVYVNAFQPGSFGDWPEQLPRAAVERIARGLVREGADRFALPSAPDGYRLAVEFPSTVTQGVRARLLVYSDGADHGFSVQLVDDTDAPPGLALTHAQARLVDVRGVQGVSSPFLNGGGGTDCRRTDAFRCDAQDGAGGGPRLSTAVPGSARYLQWLEPDGTRVTITTVGMGDDAVFTIASSLRDAAQAEFEQLVASAPVIG